MREYAEDNNRFVAQEILAADLGSRYTNFPPYPDNLLHDSPGVMHYDFGGTNADWDPPETATVFIKPDPSINHPGVTCPICLDREYGPQGLTVRQAKELGDDEFAVYTQPFLFPNLTAAGWKVWGIDKAKRDTILVGLKTWTDSTGRRLPWDDNWYKS